MTGLSILDHCGYSSITLFLDLATFLVKKLTNFTPKYRLRVGNYRVLFVLEDNKIVIYRVQHRKDSYKRERITP